MFPNAYLKTLWQMNVRPQVFVAMSFADIYKRRFDEVIAPSIRAVAVNGQPLEPFRVDFSKSGDSILTDIMDGIAHCRMFVADVSIIGNDSKSGQPYRNGNVMYEIGLAVACRQPTEVLLIRDDQERFLFDVSTIPHVHLNFADSASAKLRLQEILIERLSEIQYLNDARVVQAIASLSNEELQVIKHFGKNSKELAAVLDPLSHYYQRRLEWDKAAKTCTLVITADEKNFGPNSAETVKALEHYAVVLRAAGLRDQAEPIEARIAKIKGTKSATDN